MKLTKKLEAEILKVYHAYWDAYLNGDMKVLASMLDDNIKVFGSAVSEVFNNKAETVRFYKATADQLTGKAQFRNRKISVHPVDQTILIHEQSNLFVLIDKEWTFYGPARISALFLKTPKGWKLAHQHASFPDSRAEEGEQIAAEKIKKENLVLREAVRRRTIELEQKSRELEIEAALERVRAVAMGMKEPADMLDVCKTMSLQLQSLGLKEIRNVQTAIFYEGRGTYMNYEYYAKHKKTIITETSYTNNKVHKAFATKMLKGKGEIFVTHIKDRKVKDWLAYQKTTNVFIDRFLEKAGSLNYYWHSLGPVALGISTYAPLSKEELGLFNRFLNVFALAYTRFLDIEQALAQAREAQIEASLEKVRAQALGMRKPEDLPDVCEVLFRELQTLGFSELRNAMVNIHNDEKETFLNYDYSDVIGKSITPLFYSIHPVIEKQIKQIRSARDAFSETVFKGKDLQKWKEFRRQRGEKDDPRIKNTTALHYYFYSIGTGSIGVSTFSSIGEEKLEVLKRFRNVFDFAYRRYMDVAQAEAQAREARIEAALERVRAAAMSMHTSDDLKRVGETIFSELKSLGFSDIRNTEILINNDTKESILSHYYSDYGVSGTIEVFYNTHPVLKKWADDMKKGSDAFAEVVIHEKDMEAWRKYREEIGYLPDPKLNAAKSLWYYSYSIGLGGLSVSSFSPLTEEHLKILERFRNVFGLAYRRYADVAQAEAQAREAKIEAALEKVRSRSMAMHSSDELVEASDVVFQQLNTLGIESIRTGVATINAEKETVEVWSRAGNQSGRKILGVVPKNAHAFFAGYFDAWKRKDEFYSQEFVGEEVERYYQDMSSLLSYPSYTSYNPREVLYSFFFPDGSVNVVSQNPFKEEETRIMLRFARVFGLMYRRFLDLQKAEAQAREAKIEAALERTRTQSMLMKHSSELIDISKTFHEQLLHLGIDSEFSFVWLPDETKQEHMFWATWVSASKGGAQYQSKAINYPLDKTEPGTAACYADWESGQPVHETYVPPDQIVSFFATWEELLRGAEQLKPELFPDGIYYTEAYMKYGCFGVDIRRPLTSEEKEIIRRFSVEFERTYTRFLDLQKAEAQAREAQIEAALERVRSRTMGMQKSEELKDVIQIVYDQFVQLNIHTEHAGFIMDYKTRDDFHGWIADRFGTPSQVTLPYFDAIYYNRFNEAKEKGLDFFALTLSFEEKNRFYHDLFQHIPGFPEESKKIILDAPAFTISTVLLENVALYIENFAGIPYSEEENATLMRFGKVFEQAYTRFLDLQKAEAQAREAQIEAALERVRSRTMAMQKSDELSETSFVLFQQLRDLGEVAEQLSIGVYNEEEGILELYATIYGNQWTESGRLPFNKHVVHKTTYTAWKEGKKSIILDLSGEELDDFNRFKMEYSTQYRSEEELPRDRWVIHSAFFSKGMLSFSTHEPRPPETVQLLERFAAVFNLTLTRFNDLKLAEAQAHQAHLDLIQLQAEKKRAEEALSELRATQEQLLQQEKLASLGQLTAGIAHEIKNPLNFVNNFSSVSVELVDEAMEEIKKLTGGGGDVQQLLDDVKKNLNKIIEHGTRADGIVKSMLQHSRGGSGKKEQTDLNALVKEYANLAFHGMRAGKNPINVDITLDLDPSVGTVPLIAEDFSRVVLNLCQNAFDAMREKLNSADRSYLPKLSARTRRDSNRVVMEIEDNGPGIPDAIKDKILQPFFTTKKGTQGTGLGLSITHDIVKAHGGEMSIQTNTNGGATFVVSLEG
jgi:signal transduction histidine kinase/ketosteroid isomerase-like protein